MHRENQPNKCKLALYKSPTHFNSSLKQLYISSKMEHFSYKRWVWCVAYRGVKKELAWATYKLPRVINNIMLFNICGTGMIFPAPGFK